MINPPTRQVSDARAKVRAILRDKASWEQVHNSPEKIKAYLTGNCLFVHAKQSQSSSDELWFEVLVRDEVQEGKLFSAHHWMAVLEPFIELDEMSGVDDMIAGLRVCETADDAILGRW